MGTGQSPFRSLDEFLDWCRRAPAGTQLNPRVVAELLDDMGAETAREQLAHVVAKDEPESWREKLWTVPADTRMGVREVAEAIGRKERWVYDHTSPTTADRLPHRRLGRILVFRAGEVRTWIRSHEIEVVVGPSESSPHERRLQTHSEGRR